MCDLQVFPEMMQKMDCMEKEQRLVRTEDLQGTSWFRFLDLQP